ncbi:MAG: B12-binding domain-containing radical SAM protein [Polyangiales bacterium]
MRIVFAALGQEQLGLSILSAVLRRAGHETALAFNPALFHDRYYFDIPVLGDLFDRTQEVIEEIIAAEPDLLAFSVLTSTYTWALEVAKAVKAKLDVRVIFGGVHPSAVPEVCLENECVDFVCIGEGEAAMLSLCEALEKGERVPSAPIANLAWRGKGEEGIVRGPNAGFVQDLDALPFADKELWDDKVDVGANYGTLMARGCPYRCTFCFNNFFAKLPGKGGGKYVRQRSVEHAMRELVEAKERYDVRRVEFHDDIFTVDKEWLRTFLARYKKEIGVTFQCLVHPKFVDREVATILKDGGCDQVQMGVQSADEEYKRKNLLRMEKGKHLESALEALSAVGLRMKLDHILGFPDEPKSAQETAREIYARYAPARVNTFWLTYLPGIEMTRRALEIGELTQEQVDEINRGKARLFRHLEHFRPGTDLDFYQRYDLLFRILPAVPQSVRDRLRADHIPSLSNRTANSIGFLFDLFNATRRLDPETFVFIGHYLKQMAKQLPEMLGAPRKPIRILPPIATKPARPQKKHLVVHAAS